MTTDQDRPRWVDDVEDCPLRGPGHFNQRHGHGHYESPTTEQAESAASSVDLIAACRRHLGKVSEAGKWALAGLTYQELKALLETLNNKSADLERVTAERDAALEVVKAARKSRACVGSTNKHQAACNDCPCPTCEDFFDAQDEADLALDTALARFDATRKAAADAEDRDVETARQMLRDFEEVEG